MTERIERKLRRQIITGKFKPGERMPPMQEMSVAHKANPKTIQNVMAKLAGDGLVSMHGVKGTYVNDKPPHLSRFGIVLRESPNDPDASAHQLAQKLWLTARQRNGRDPRDVAIYGNAGNCSGMEARQLIEDAKAGCLAGAIFIEPCPSQQASVVEALIAAKTPVVFATGCEDALPGGVRVVRMPLRRVIDRGMAELAAQGAKRIGVLANMCDAHHADDVKLIKRAAKKHKLKLHAAQIQGVSPQMAYYAKQAVSLMQKAESRLDGLLLMDEALIDSALVGLSVGPCKARKMAVVAVSHFPVSKPAARSVTRVGFDANAVLELCKQMIIAKRKGRGGRRKVEMPVLTMDGATAVTPCQQ